MTVREPVAAETVDEAFDRLALFLTLNTQRDDMSDASEAMRELVGLNGPALGRIASRICEFTQPENAWSCMLGVLMGMLIAEQERWEAQ